MSEYPSPFTIEKTLDQSVKCDDLVFVAYALPNSYKGATDLDKRLLALISGLRKKIKVFVLIGNPYAARELPELECILYAYSGADAEKAAVDVLSGKHPSLGRLPVQITSTEASRRGSNHVA